MKKLATDLDGAVVQRLATELGAPALKELADQIAPTMVRDLVDTLGKGALLRLKTSLGVDGLKQITDAITPAQLKAFVDEIGEGVLGDAAMTPVVAQAASTGRATLTIRGYFVGLTKIGSDVRLVQFYPDPGNPSVPKAVMRGIVQLFKSM